MTQNKAVASIAIGAVALIGVITSFTSVGVGQVSVITRFGSVNRELQSGVYLKLPYGMETSNKFDVKTQKDTAEAAAASQDLQDVKATVVTNYHVEQGKVGELFRTVGVDYKARIIDPAIQEAVKASTAKYPVLDLITKRTEVKNEVLKVLKDRLNTRGILVEDISLTNIDFSATFTRAIEQKQVADQQAQQAKYLAVKAENEANAAIATAKGQAESQRLLNETASDKTIELKQLEVQQQAIAKWNGIMPTYNGTGNLLFNIPSK